MIDWNDETKTIIIPYTGTETTVPIINEHKTDCVSIIVEDGYTVVPGGCFSNFVSLQYVNLPDSIQSIGNNVFASTQIKTFHIPLNYKDVVSNQPFDYQTTLEEFTVDSNHQYFSTIDGSLYSKDGKILYFYASGKTQTIFTIPYCTQTIFTSSISWNNYLEIIIFPPSILTIGNTFCWKITNLKRVIFLHCFDSYELMEQQISFSKKSIFLESNLQYEDIEWLYSNTLPYLSSKGTYLTIETNPWCKNNTNNIKQFTFNYDFFVNNNHIKTINILPNITEIGDSCFSGCKNLQHLILPESIQIISKNAFSSCKNLKKCSSISYPESKYDFLSEIFTSTSISICEFKSHKNPPIISQSILFINIILPFIIC